MKFTHTTRPKFKIGNNLLAVENYTQPLIEQLLRVRIADNKDIILAHV